MQTPTQVHSKSVQLPNGAYMVARETSFPNGVKIIENITSFRNPDDLRDLYGYQIGNSVQMLPRPGIVQRLLGRY